MPRSTRTDDRILRKTRTLQGGRHTLYDGKLVLTLGRRLCRNTPFIGAPVFKQPGAAPAGTDNRMFFRCLSRPSRIVDNTNESPLHSMSKNELIELCLRERERNTQLTLAAESDRARLGLTTKCMHDMQVVHTEARMANVLLINTRDSQLNEMSRINAALSGEVECLRRSEQGLRNAVHRQVRDITLLRNEMRAMSGELKARKCLPEPPTVQHPVPATIIDGAKAMLDEMEDFLTDPVTFEHLTDPITLSSGHTYNRGTVLEIFLHSSDRVTCPMTRERIIRTHRSYNDVPKATVVAKLVDLYERMRHSLDAIIRQIDQV